MTKVNTWNLCGTQEQTQSCCGVLELGDLWRSDKICLGDYPYGNLKATQAGVNLVLKEIEDTAKSDYGMIVCYVLPDQSKGCFGRALRARRWKYLGSFWNPKTGNTLRHYSKTLHKTAPKKKKKTKSVFNR